MIKGDVGIKKLMINKTTGMFCMKVSIITVFVSDISSLKRRVTKIPMPV
jgi:hypothetical protein